MCIRSQLFNHSTKLACRVQLFRFQSIVIAESQRRDIEGIKKASRDEADRLREAMAEEQAAMEREHQEELRQLTDHLALEKERMKEELLLQASEAESRVAESQLGALQLHAAGQNSNRLIKGQVKELALRRLRDGALGKAAVLACIDRWRHHTLHEFMIQGLELELPEPECPPPAVEHLRRMAQARARELQTEIIFVKGMRDPNNLAAVHAALAGYASRVGLARGPGWQ